MNFLSSVERVFDIDTEANERSIALIVVNLMNRSRIWKMRFSKKAVFATLGIIFEKEMAKPLYGIEREHFYNQVWIRYTSMFAAEKEAQNG